MDTEQLIDRLAREAAPVGRHVVERRIVGSLAIGAAVSLPVMLGWLGLRADLAQAIRTPMFWVKLAYPLAVAAAAAALACRLARTGRGSPGRWLAAQAPFILIALAGAASLLFSPASTRLADWLGASWTVCPLRVAALAAPSLVAAALAIRSLAPVELRSAGAAAGLAAGGVGAAVYALSCPETGLAFLATWYSLGMLVCAAVGAWIGPRALRW